MTFIEPTGQSSSGLPANFSMLLPSGDTLRHILLGKPHLIRQTVHLLHNLRYVEISQWSPLIEVPDKRLVLTTEPDEVISLLSKRL